MIYVGAKGSVMVNNVNVTYSHLGDKPLCVPVGFIWIRLIEMGRPSLTRGKTFPLFEILGWVKGTMWADYEHPLPSASPLQTWYQLPQAPSTMPFLPWPKLLTKIKPSSLNFFAWHISLSATGEVIQYG